jgi:hypothetical protein
VFQKKNNILLCGWVGQSEKSIFCVLLSKFRYSVACVVSKKTSISCLIKKESFHLLRWYRIHVHLLLEGYISWKPNFVTIFLICNAQYKKNEIGSVLYADIWPNQAFIMGFLAASMLFYPLDFQGLILWWCSLSHRSRLIHFLFCPSANQS